ncbi:citrate synthase [Arvimicrobium flavum]|uniref:citrate synthase n=1 Tax=Arvimicrobium flavum TaxID=3393320 RepID=UPI00237B35CC|nr:citrate synthase [Mesorhizobium shangrilense]
MTHHPKSLIGLDGVAAAETRLSHIDGERGVLVIAGEAVERLALEAGFEEVAARLWSLADAQQRDATSVGAALATARLRAFDRLPAMLAVTEGMPIVAAFRAAVAALQPDPDLPPEAAIVGAMPVIAAALVRARQGEQPVAPSADLPHAADTLRMIRGVAPSDAEAKALDTYLVTVSDHSMNASTFAARVVASTGAGLFMAVTAGYCALTGPLHGGAPEPVLEMLDAIGRRENIAPWIDAALVRGERLMGFGHRVYRVRDPRADVLKHAVGLLGRSEAELGLAAEVEAYARQALARAKPDRALDTNVEFYTAILLDALGIPRQAFTPIFAAARAAGWTAHALEQQKNGRLLRPAAAYVGTMPAG